jgi:THO complex subunit 1
VRAAVIFTVMEDVMELCTIEEAEGVFGYLESRLDRLRAMFNFTATAHSKLSVLRICNQLLRRLSRRARCARLQGGCAQPGWSL